MVVFHKGRSWVHFCFSHYVNDICRAVPGENIKLFADDTNLFIFDGDSDKLTQRANNCLKELDNWFKANKLALSLGRKTYMVFSPRRILSIKLLLNNVEIEKADTCKYVGIYLYDQLNWKHHIDYICEKLVTFTEIFYRLRSKISCEWLRNIYYSFVNILTYYTELRCMPIHLLLI